MDRFAVDWTEATPGSARTSVSSRSTSIDCTTPQENGGVAPSPLFVNNSSSQCVDTADVGAAVAAKFNFRSDSVARVNGNDVSLSGSEIHLRYLFNIRPSNNLGQPKQGAGGAKLTDMGMCVAIEISSLLQLFFIKQINHLIFKRCHAICINW
jgi:hypothetical protein